MTEKLRDLAKCIHCSKLMEYHEVGYRLDSSAICQECYEKTLTFKNKGYEFQIPTNINNNVNNPKHYGGANNPYEAIKIIEALNLNFNRGNSFKYIARAGKKNPLKEIEDLEKAIWYLQREVMILNKKEEEQVYTDQIREAFLKVVSKDLSKQ